jgi:hypothetical protein
MKIYYDLVWEILAYVPFNSTNNIESGKAFAESQGFDLKEFPPYYKRYNRRKHVILADFKRKTQYFERDYRRCLNELLCESKEQLARIYQNEIMESDRIQRFLQPNEYVECKKYSPYFASKAICIRIDLNACTTQKHRNALVTRNILLQHHDVNWTELFEHND